MHCYIDKKYMVGYVYKNECINMMINKCMVFMCIIM